jgi:hypothetical protein
VFWVDAFGVGAFVVRRLGAEFFAVLCFEADSVYSDCFFAELNRWVSIV